MLRKLLATTLAFAALAVAGGPRSAQAQGTDQEPPADIETEPAAHADDAAPPSSDASEAVVPPKLLEAAAAPYPDAALDEAREGRVVLRLTIDRDGRVASAEVLEAAGFGFDEAAQAAALRCRFAPARRGDVAVPAIILHAYDFSLPPATAAPPPVGSAPPAGQQPRPESPAARRAQASEREVTVTGKSLAQRRRESAEAVTVIELAQAQREAADLGEVLARSQGVSVRREGGLGSSARLSLSGLTDDQIRFFLDGVPLELAGYPFGIANVPVDLVEHVEVYRGVVPIRFGADALGGAVHLLTDDDLFGTRGSASYQAGSFGTHRLSLGARHLDEPSGFFTRLGAFLDHADNDYPIRITVPDQRPETRGQLVAARAYRFHDAYSAAGVTSEFGLVQRRWAKKLLLRLFLNDFRKQLQNNPTGELPYGDVEFGERGAGASVRYEQRLTPRLRFDAIAGYTVTGADFLDTGTCVYSWFGECLRERLAPGEIEEGEPRDDFLRERTLYSRLLLDMRVLERQALRLSISPSYVSRDGEDRMRSVSPIATHRDLLTLIAGIEHELDAFQNSLENMLFAKSYAQLARSDEPVIGGVVRELKRDTLHFGAGDALRFRFTPWLYAKASYEYATRLPRADELFGDAVLTNANLDLEPEVSHNGNLGITLDARHGKSGDFRADLNAFVRALRNLILPLVAFNERLRNENVYAARSLGVEASAGWTSRHELLSVDANFTYLDFRNVEGRGPFAPFKGDRIPNRPYFLVNGAAQIQLPEIVAASDRLSLRWYTRYVHEFFEFWESAGQAGSKRTIDAQLIHSAALNYLTRNSPRSLSFSGEVDNISDADAYDFWGVQRPGRAVFFKVAAQL